MPWLPNDSEGEGGGGRFIKLLFFFYSARVMIFGSLFVYATCMLIIHGCIPCNQCHLHGARDVRGLLGGGTAMTVGPL